MSSAAPPDDSARGELDRLYRARSKVLAARVARGARADEGLDIVHEAFARVLERSESVRDSIVSAEAFLVRISANLVADRARRQKTRERWAGNAAASAPLHHDPVASLESRDALRRLEAALMKLNPVTREVFVARRVEGLSYGEIAERTGLSSKAVEKRMAKAIAKLSRLMDRC